MDPIKQYDDISFPKLNKNQKAQSIGTGIFLVF